MPEFYGNEYSGHFMFSFLLYYVHFERHKQHQIRLLEAENRKYYGPKIYILQNNNFL